MLASFFLILLIKVPFHNQVELLFFRFGLHFEDLLIYFIYFREKVVFLVVVEFIVDFEAACWDYLEDSVPVVFEVEDIIECLISGSVIRKSFRSEESLVRFGFVSLQENAMAVFQILSFIVFGHFWK